MFRYDSTQTHSDLRDGVPRTKTQRITIRGSKGHKEVTIHTNGRKKTAKKKLTKKEIACIRACQFIPGLFRNCEKCLL